ncbi:unnamed protein product [Gulo gulo]|uniref:Uncharacterized protein n=1 Tax=Gulo gulo TaxID=48420 RepID=A0A9X9LI45_GULGU|nr:unnamed protein product [Gulo gulo]
MCVLGMEWKRPLSIKPNSIFTRTGCPPFPPCAPLGHSNHAGGTHPEPRALPARTRDPSKSKATLHHAARQFVIYVSSLLSFLQKVSKWKVVLFQRLIPVDAERVSTGRRRDRERISSRFPAEQGA